jgi:hypothetical protein
MGAYEAGAMKYGVAIWLAALLAATTPLNSLKAQVEEEIIEEEDDETGVPAIDPTKLVATGVVKAYCSNRILGQAPTKLVTLGYDYQAAQKLSSDGGPESSINNVQTLRFAVNYPVFSRNTALLNLGMDYQRTQYDFATDANGLLPNSFHAALNDAGLTRIGFTPTLFKPLDRKRFILAQASLNLFTNNVSESAADGNFRYQAALIYGWKVSDRKMWGLGATRTYLGGALNYLPIIYYRYSSRDEQWGIEAVLPSRAQYRRTLNDKNIINAGFYVEGGSFNMRNLAYPVQGGNEAFVAGTANDALRYVELRRAELRFNLSYDVAISKLFWITAEAGYRYNWSFDVDERDFFRSLFADDPFIIENRLTNPVYFQVSVSFVSP